jgi:hypothetical protein
MLAQPQNFLTTECLSNWMLYNTSEGIQPVCGIYKLLFREAYIKYGPFYMAFNAMNDTVSTQPHKALCRQ